MEKEGRDFDVMLIQAVEGKERGLMSSKIEKLGHESVSFASPCLPRSVNSLKSSTTFSVLLWKKIIFVSFHDICWLCTGSCRPLFAVVTVVFSIPVHGYLYVFKLISSCLIIVSLLFSYFHCICIKKYFEFSMDVLKILSILYIKSFLTEDLKNPCSPFYPQKSRTFQ